MQLVHDYSPAEFRNNVIALAKLRKLFNLPTVLTTSYSPGPNGPFLPEVVKMHPEAPLIDRPGIISAWDDPKFVAAVEKTGRKDLIMAGVTIDICLAFAALQVVDAGYNVYGVIDASGGYEVTIRENAVARMRDHGWTTIGAELQRNWARADRSLVLRRQPAELQSARPGTRHFDVGAACGALQVLLRVDLHRLQMRGRQRGHRDGNILQLLFAASRSDRHFFQRPCRCAGQLLGRAGVNHNAQTRGGY